MIVRVGVILSWCIGVYRSDDRVEVGLEMVAEYRKRGFGLAVSRAYTNEFLSRGLIIDWLCNYENLPSISIAKDLRFEEKAEDSVYEIRL
jgi:RimJ/RimL family protein N-acetyltransferase